MTENKNSFLARIRPILAPSDVNRIKVAYLMSKDAHRPHTRKELDSKGNPLRYFEHVRRVALILMDEVHCHDPDMIIAALFHDAVEDTQDITLTIIEQFFGPTVARYVACLSKVPKFGYVERLWHCDDNTLLLKACDRLDNLRSIPMDNLEFSTKQRKETLDAYIPLFRDRVPFYVLDMIETLAKPVTVTKKKKKKKNVAAVTVDFKPGGNLKDKLDLIAQLGGASK